jgi:two-component system sensor histidine kinase HydH
MAMAALAAIALFVTVFIAQRALAHASDVVVRGEADALVSAVAADLADEGTPATSAILERELATHAAKGLRYVAVFERDRVIAEAGSAMIPDAKLRPGESSVVERRVRVAGMVPRGPREPGRPRGWPALLVIELEPPVIEQLRSNLTRLSIVAVGASGVLIAFAFALSRSAKRLAAIEQRAQREQRLVALGSMSSVMAHELRNPLASLKGHAQLLAEDLEDAKQRKKADRVVADAQRLEDLTTSLLDFVRDGPIERAPIAADELVARSLEDLPRDRVDVKTETTKPMVVDQGRLARALHNLVDNAHKASPDEGRVELSITTEQNDIVITVRDHGPGIPPDSAIFEPFVTTRVRGTGLGLPVARRIAEQHDGTLTAANDPSGGAVFTLRFPHSPST